MRRFVLLLVLLAQASWAAPRTAVVGLGECNGDLVQDVRGLDGILQQRVGGGLITEEEFRRVVGEPPRDEISTLKYQLERARIRFYEGNYREAAKDLTRILQSLRTLPPSDENARIQKDGRVLSERWRLTAEIQTYRALSFKKSNELGAAREAFIDILRVNFAHKLDEEQFTPSTRQELERIREELKPAPRDTVDIVSDRPGATVYLDGLGVGKTPLKLKLLPGTYPIVLGLEGTYSFPRTVQVNGDTTLRINLAFETRIAPSRVPCFKEATSHEDVSADAAQIGELLKADTLVLLTRESKRAGGDWLRASVFDVPTSRKVREGAINVVSGARQPEGLGDLATFVLTGSARNVVPVKSVPQPLAASPASSPASVSEAFAPPGPEPHLDRRTVTYSLLGVAVAGAGVALGFELASNNAASQFNSIYAGPGPITQNEIGSTQALANASKTDRTVAWVALGVGAASAVSAGVLFVLPHGDNAPSVAVGLGPRSIGLRVDALP